MARRCLMEGVPMLDRRRFLGSSIALTALALEAPRRARAEAAPAGGPAALDALFDVFMDEHLGKSPEQLTVLGLDKDKYAWARRELDDVSLERAAAAKAENASRLARLRALPRASVSGMDRATTTRSSTRWGRCSASPRSSSARERVRTCSASSPAPTSRCRPSSTASTASRRARTRIPTWRGSRPLPGCSTRRSSGCVTTPRSRWCRRTSCSTGRSSSCTRCVRPSPRSRSSSPPSRSAPRARDSRPTTARRRPASSAARSIPRSSARSRCSRSCAAARCTMRA